MFDTIILLTGPAEHSVFTTLLQGHNSDLTVLPVFTADDLAAIEPEWLRRGRLVSFTTSVIVPGAVLDQLGYGAYHFHPGSPQYPGRAPARAALDGGASEFGGTVHRMTADRRPAPSSMSNGLPLPMPPPSLASKNRPIRLWS
jgi:methionyl-tRNA formyltransferase